MAINTNQRNDYVGNGVTSTFPYTFKIFAETDLQVTIRDTTGNETALSWPVQFSVLGVGNPAGGSITLTAGSLTSNWSLAIKRIRPFSQGTSLSNQSAYQADTHENTFDHLTMLAQQLKDLTDRAIKVQTSLALGPLNLVLPTPVPSNVLGWDVAGTSIINIPAGVNVPSAMDAANVTFTQQGAGAIQRTVRSSLRGLTIAPEDFNAVGDGSSDDWTAVNAALSELASLGGGRFQFGQGKSYKLSKVLQINSSNIVLDGNGSEIVFSPTGPYVTQVNDRILNIGTISPNIDGPHLTNGAAIAAGDRSFVMASALSAAPGDWVIVCEIEPNMPGGPDVIRIEFAQVSSVVGTTVNVYTPFRVTLPGTHSTPQVFRIADAAMVKNVTIQNLRARSSNNAQIMAGVTTAHARNIAFDNVESSPINGQPFYSYRTAGLQIRNSRSLLAAAAWEFAESCDLALQGNLLADFGQTPRGPALRINMGTHAFAIQGNVIRTAGDVGMYILDGPLNGVVSGNTFSFVTKNSISVGIFARGMQNVAVEGNYLAGDTPGTGIASVSQTGMVVNVPSQGNVFKGNVIKGFSSAYGTKLAADLYDTVNENASGIMSLANGINLGTDITGPDALLAIRQGTAVLAERLEIEGDSTYYRGFDQSGALRRHWFGFNDKTARHAWLDNHGLLVLNNDPTVQGGLQIGTAGCTVRGAFKAVHSLAAADFSLNPITANLSATAHVTVAGAVVGDLVMIATDGNIGTGLIIGQGYVTAANDVVVPVGNVTTGALAPTTRNYTVLVLRLA